MPKRIPTLTYDELYKMYDAVMHNKPDTEVKCNFYAMLSCTKCGWKDPRYPTDPTTTYKNRILQIVIAPSQAACYRWKYVYGINKVTDKVIHVVTGQELRALSFPNTPVVIRWYEKEKIAPAKIAEIEHLLQTMFLRSVESQRQHAGS